MKVYEGLEAAAGRLAGAAVTIGNFDGVHLGHQRLVSTARALADERDTASAALTFWPHPAKVLAPELAPPIISTRARRRELLASCGLDAVVEIPFDRTFASLPADTFARALLDDLGAGSVVVGYDFTYGRGREGNVDTLRAACEARGARLEIVSPVTVNGLVVSSTKVREFVLGGKVEAAEALLGRPFDLDGTVVSGKGRGRTIGVPTANVDAATELLPAIGVYAVRVLLPDGSWADGACNVGLNPTFTPESGADTRALSVEVHLLDRSLDLYGQQLRLSFLARLRDERRFSSVDALVTQIRQDIADAREVLAARR